MGSTFDYVPVRLTKAFRDAQADESFLGWLKMQDAVMDIEFPYFDVPEIRGIMFTKASLDVVESKLIARYPNTRAAFDGADNLHSTMRFVYYVGETYRRAFEGTWAVLPPSDQQPAPMPAVDLPCKETFTVPMTQIGMALGRRTGTDISLSFGLTERLFTKWVADGRPERVYRGTLREGD